MAEEYVGRKFTTQFAHSPVNYDQSLLEKLVRFSHELFSQGLTFGAAGNISARSGDGFLIKRGGVSFGDVSASDFVFVSRFDFDGNTAYVDGSLEPSSESPTHALVYERFPTVGAVVHLHDEVVLKSPQKAIALGAIETGEVADYGTLKLALGVAAALEQSSYVLIRNHGIITVGGDLDEAVEKAFFYHRNMAGSV
ncbi:MAG: class II aldolase/adducin family protein [Candidatus Altiarchaeota archaeon]